VDRCEDVLVAPASNSIDRDEGGEPGHPHRHVLVDAATGRMTASLGSHCFGTTASRAMSLLATLANCRSGVAPTKGLELFDSAANCMAALPISATGSRMINELPFRPRPLDCHDVEPRVKDE